MATLTRNDINTDITMISESLNNELQPLVSVGAAFRLSGGLSFTCVSFYLIVLLWKVFNFTPPADDFFSPTYLDSLVHYMGMYIAAVFAAAVFAGAISLILYPTSIAYLSVPKSVRDRSVIINRIKVTVRKVAKIIVFVNGLFAIAGCLISMNFLMLAPFSVMFSFIALQIIIGAELTRYGVAPLMEKLVKLIKKI